MYTEKCAKFSMCTTNHSKVRHKTSLIISKILLKNILKKLSNCPKIANGNRSTFMACPNVVLALHLAKINHFEKGFFLQESSQ